MPGPTIKPFDSMKVKTVIIFLVYDMSSYWLYYPILGMKMFLTRFSPKWFLDSVWALRNHFWENLVKNILRLNQ